MTNDYESYEPQEQNTTSHISYKDYKKMLNKNSKKQSFKLFLGAFFVLLLIFLGLAKMMSPDVDITLGDDNPQYEENMPRGEIDDRLRDLQMEDDGFLSSERDATAVEDGEKVVIPKKDINDGAENKLPEETLGQKAVKDVVGEPQVQHTAPKPQPQNVQPVPAPAPAPVAVQPSITARVVVGNYPTVEQAEVAKSILQEAGLGVSPFVRKSGTGYTLQVASYGSKEKAMSVAESLLNQNFPAKVVVEYK